MAFVKANIQMEWFKILITLYNRAILLKFTSAAPRNMLVSYPLQKLMQSLETFL